MSTKSVPKWKEMQLAEEKRVASLKMAEQQVRETVASHNAQKKTKEKRTSAFKVFLLFFNFFFFFFFFVFFFFFKGQVEQIARTRIDWSFARHC
jgi:ATP-dependent Zn protease